jgi:N-acetylmuramoyl-L-alanine amidase
VEPRITIQYPRDPQVVAHGRTFVLGRVVPPDSRLLLNGDPVQVHRRGGFLAVVPVCRGKNTLEFKATRGNTVASLRTVLEVRCARLHDPKESPQIDTSSVTPHRICPVGRDEELWVSFAGTPGCTATCGYMGRGDRVDLQEILRPGGVTGYAGAEDALGMYFGQAPPPLSEYENLILELASPTDDITTQAGPKIRLLSQERWAAARQLTCLRPSPWGPPDWWLPKNCPVRVRGTMGECFLVERQGVLLGWGRDLEPYDGVPPEPVRLPAPAIRASHENVLVEVRSQKPLPYRVTLSRDRRRVDITFAGGVAQTDLSTAKSCARYTEDGGVTRLTLDFAQEPVWGYRCSCTDEGLCVVVRRPPRSTSLTGMLICLDPGHGSQPGAVGPTGIREQGVNLALAVELERCLTGRGARVIVTRRGAHGPSLAERVAIAEESRADVLLSLHHNAVPDGVDPYLNMGTSVYYFHEHCKQLARRLQDALVPELGLGDLGIKWGDFALCRGTFMPSVLLEPAFMISPEHEALVITRRYRRRCSEAITKGLEAYVRDAVK